MSTRFTSSHQSGPKWLRDASALEAELGPEQAIAVIREKIVVTDRGGRRRLYRIHDEIIRRHGVGLLKPYTRLS